MLSFLPDVEVRQAALSGGTIWMADHESGNLIEWRAGMNPNMPAEYDSGLCIRPAKGVTTEKARSGQYAMKLTIYSIVKSGCRQFRWVESTSGQPLYYSAWFYFPQASYVTNWWNIFQFKSDVRRGGKNISQTFWFLRVTNNAKGEMQLGLVWKDGRVGRARQYYNQSLVTLPVKKWIHLEVYLKQSEQMDGQVIVWQDGVELFNVTGVSTKHVGGLQSWSVNNYGAGVYPAPNSILIDEAVVSTERVGPNLLASAK
jgi:hypothetical protein